MYARDRFCLTRDLICLFIMSIFSSDNTECVSNDDCTDSIGGGCSTDSSAENRKLLPFDKAKNAVWQYFGFPVKNGDFEEKDKRKEEKFIANCA